MSEWKECILDDIAYIIPGYAFKSKHFGKLGTPVIKITDINPPYINGKNAMRVDLSHYDVAKLSKYYLEQNDFVIAMTGATIGKNGRLIEDTKAIVNQRVAKILPKEDVVRDFVYYCIQGSDFQGFIQNNIDSHSAQENISGTSIGRYPVLLPPLPEQKAIASVLSSLDDKIDLLHRQNKTLEVMAETLFRQWFVEEAQEDWEDGVLSDEFDFTMGQSPVGSSYNQEGIGMPMFQGNADFGFRFPEERVFTTEPKRLAFPHDTLISVRAPVGAQNMAQRKCCIGRGVSAFRYRHKKNFYTYTYFKLRSLMDEIRKFNDEGTVFGSIGKTDFQQMEIVLAPKDLIENFENEAKPLNDKVIENCIQIRTLEKLRDTFLPKLMSGEVRVEM